MARSTPRGIQHVEVVQRAVKPFALNELLGQGALAGLPRARDHNSRHHRQPLGEAPLTRRGRAFMEWMIFIHHMNANWAATGVDVC